MIPTLEDFRKAMAEWEKEKPLWEKKVKDEIDPLKIPEWVRTLYRQGKLTAKNLYEICDREYPEIFVK